MRQHHAQRPELPVFYNIHSVSNFISLANALLVEIIEAWKSKAMEEISQLWNVKLLSKRVPISNHIKKGVWKDNQDFSQLNVFFTSSFPWECSSGAVPGTVILTSPQTLFGSCRFSVFFPSWSICNGYKAPFRLFKVSNWESCCFHFIFALGRGNLQHLQTEAKEEKPELKVNTHSPINSY